MGVTKESDKEQPANSEARELFQKQRPGRGTVPLGMQRSCQVKQGKSCGSTRIRPRVHACVCVRAYVCVCMHVCVRTCMSACVGGSSMAGQGSESSARPGQGSGQESLTGVGLEGTGGEGAEAVGAAGRAGKKGACRRR